MAHPIAKPWAGHPRHHRSAESAIRLVAGSKQVRITHPSVATVRRIVHDIGCASEEEAAVANVPDSPRGTPAAESGGQYEKRTHRLTRGGGGFHSRSAGFGESIRKGRSEEHTSELQSLMRNSYAVFCLKKKKNTSINGKQ